MFNMSYQTCNILFIIRTTLLTRFNTEKLCKEGVNNHFIIGASALSGSLYMMSRDQLSYVMTSSASHGDAFILSGTHVSNRRIMIYSLRTNTSSGI